MELSKIKKLDWYIQQDCFWINMFLICHKGSYGLSSSPTVLQIFTPRCEDMPETQLWATIGQWDRHPWPGNKTKLLLLSLLLSLETLLSPETLSPLWSPQRLLSTYETLVSWALIRALFSSSALFFWALPSWPLWWALLLSSLPETFFWTSAAQSCELQLQQTKRTPPYSGDVRSCVAPEHLASAAVPRPAS